MEIIHISNLVPGYYYLCTTEGFSKMMIVQSKFESWNEEYRAYIIKMFPSDMVFLNSYLIDEKLQIFETWSSQPYINLEYVKSRYPEYFI